MAEGMNDALIIAAALIALGEAGATEVEKVAITTNDNALRRMLTWPDHVKWAEVELSKIRARPADDGKS